VTISPRLSSCWKKLLLLPSVVNIYLCSCFLVFEIVETQVNNLLY